AQGDDKRSNDSDPDFPWNFRLHFARVEIRIRGGRFNIFHSLVNSSPNTQESLFTSRPQSYRIYVLIVFETLERMSEGGPRVLNMKKNKNIPTSMNQRSISQARRAAQAKRAPLVDAASVANEVLFAHSDTVDALNAIMRHPRSLNRDIANWRPPIKQLPG